MILLPTDIDIDASHRTFDDLSGFTQRYDIATYDPSTGSYHYGGTVPLWKNLDDLRRYRRVIERERPDVVVETGTRWAGFAAWLVGEFGVKVITIDVDDQVDGRPEEIPGVVMLTGSSVDPEIVAQVREIVGGLSVMVSLDSDHHMPHVIEEIRSYGPLVTPGQYLVVEDGLADLVTDEEARRFGHDIPERGGPLRAITRTLQRDMGWERDTATENLTPVTHHPAGWWRKL